MSSFEKVLLVIIIFTGISVTRVNLNIEIEKISSQKKFIPPSENIKHLTFGFNEILADSLWLRWIQNFDECGKELSRRSSVIKPVKLAENNFSGELTKVQKEKVCNQGWSFRMLDAITDLSPKFRAPYAVGASNLSVIAEDHIGAKIIFEKGFKNFPNDWSMLYRGAYHFLYELNDLKTAGIWLKRAADSGGPDWLYSLSSRVYTEAGQVEFGIKRLEDYLKGQSDPELINSIKQRILRLKKLIIEK